jgi:hypothetical protein
MLMLHMYFVYRTREFLFSNFFCQNFFILRAFYIVSFGVFAAIFV